MNSMAGELRVTAMAVDHEGGLLLAAEEGGIFRTPGPLAAARQLPIPAANFVQLACGGPNPDSNPSPTPTLAPTPT